MSTHSRYGASKRDMHAGCPGSARMSLAVPKQKAGPHAEYGTRAHSAAEAALRNQPWEHLCGDAEMRDIVEMYFREIRTREAFGGKLYVETRVTLPEAHAECSGTLDAAIYFANRLHLDIIDLKAGAGVEVDAEENKQLLQYGASFLRRFNLPVNTVTLTIVQPRAPSGNKVKSWDTDALRLFEEVETIRREIAACEAPDAPLIPGDWCRWCPAAAVCPALRKDAAVDAAVEFAPEPVIGTLSPAESARLGRAYLQIPQLEAYIKAVSKLAHSEAEAGRPPPGTKLVAKRAGNRKWAVTDGTVEKTLLSRINVNANQLFDHTLKSPAQIEKLLPAKEREAALEGLTTRESSGFTLVAESDPRPPAAVLVVDAATEFAAKDSENE